MGYGSKAFTCTSIFRFLGLSIRQPFCRGHGGLQRTCRVRFCTTSKKHGMPDSVCVIQISIFSIIVKHYDGFARFDVLGASCFIHLSCDCVQVRLTENVSLARRGNQCSSCVFFCRSLPFCASPAPSHAPVSYVSCKPPGGPADPFLDPGPWTLWLSECYLRPPWGNLGLSWENLGATWAHLGAILGLPGAILGLSWDNLGPGPPWAS